MPQKYIRSDKLFEQNGRRKKTPLKSFLHANERNQGKAKDNANDKRNHGFHVNNNSHKKSSMREYS